jgi:hypothetical protein
LEFSYNFFDSLKKYDFDSDCKIFLMIMNGELAEEVQITSLSPFLLTSHLLLSLSLCLRFGMINWCSSTHYWSVLEITPLLSSFPLRSSLGRVPKRRILISPE